MIVMQPKFACFYGTQSGFVNGFGPEEVAGALTDEFKNAICISIDNYQGIFKPDQSIRDGLRAKASKLGIKLAEVNIDANQFMPESIKRMFSSSPDHVDITRRNIIEMVDGAIFSFLKLPPSGKFDPSEVDSIFRAKHDLLLGMLPEIEKGWRDICNSVYSRVKKFSLEDTIVIMNLELRYAVGAKFQSMI